MAESGLQARVHFLGAKARPAALHYLSAFDVAVMPDSNTYRSPMKLFEYAAAGCPMVAPDTAPVREVFSDGQHAVLCRPEPDALAEAITRLLSDPLSASAMAGAARDLILSKHTWNAAGKLVHDEVINREEHR